MSDVYEYFLDGKPATRTEVDAAMAAVWEGEVEIRFVEILHPDAVFLVGRDYDVHSQFGENGLIEAIFEKIGTRNRWCFEVGAGDGETLSNTKVLRDEGWSAFLIESDTEQFRRLSWRFEKPADRVFCINSHVGRDSLDWILATTWNAIPEIVTSPHNLDLGIIDIDGQDYHVFDGLKKYRPRVLMVEFNQVDDPPPPLDGEGQAGLTAILMLGLAKGYVPLVRTNVNVIFVAEEEWR